MTRAITVLVVDDHPTVRDGLRAVLARADGLDVVGEAGTGEEVLSVTIDPAEVAEVREAFPVLADRRLGR